MTSTPTLATPAPGRQPTAPRPLAELEGIIERGLETFVEVGHALMEIRERRLYKPAYATFDAYLKGRWRTLSSRSYASRLIAAARVVDVLPVGNTPPNEAQARELVPLLSEPDKLRTVAATVHAKHGKQATAAVVRAEVRKVHPVKAKARAAKTATASPSAARSPLRRLRNPIPLDALSALIDASHGLAVHAKSAGHKRCCWRPADAVLQIIRRLTRQLPAGAVRHEAP